LHLAISPRGTSQLHHPGDKKYTIRGTFLVANLGRDDVCTQTTTRIGESNNSTNDIYRTLIKFDLSSIPANAMITSATLSLWTANDYSDNDRTIRVYRLKVPFNELQATWNEAASGVSWESAGCFGRQ
jgi:hypothetical protein